MASDVNYASNDGLYVGRQCSDQQFYSTCARIDFENLCIETFGVPFRSLKDVLLEKVLYLLSTGDLPRKDIWEHSGVSATIRAYRGHLEEADLCFLRRFS